MPRTVAASRGVSSFFTVPSAGSVHQKNLSEVACAENMCSALASPKQLEAELDLPRRGGCARDRSSRWRNARRSKDHRVGQVKIRTIEQIEYLGAKLKGEALANASVLQGGEVPGRKAGTDQGIAANVAVKAEVRGHVGGSKKRVGVEPLGRLAKDDGTGEIRVDEGTHRIACVAVARRVVTQLRGEGQAALQGHDGVDRPATDKPVGESTPIVNVALATANRQ